MPALASPDLIVSLGNQPALPTLYDSSGLLRSLLALDRTQNLPTGTAPGGADSKLDADLETVLGIDSTAGRLGGADPALATRPGGELARALKTVLAAGETEAGNADLALEKLLARAMEGLSGTNAAGQSRSAADALNFAGSATATDARHALDALTAKQLELVASALDLATPGAASSGVRSDSSAAVFNRQFAGQIEEAIAIGDPKQPRQRRIGLEGTADILLSGSSLLSDVSVLSGSSLFDSVPLPVLAEEAGAETPEVDLSLPFEIEAALRGSLAYEADRGRVADGKTALRAKLNLAGDHTSPVEPQRPTIPPQHATTMNRSANVDTPPPAHLGVVATSPVNAAREPRYAEIAASMNMGAAVYRFQTSVSTGVPPGDVDPLRTVLHIRSTPAVDKVA